MVKKILMAAFAATVVFSGATISNAQHIVQKGDTLSKIAKQYNMSYKDILQLNPQFDNPNLIHIGDKVIVRTVDVATDLVDYARSLQDKTTYVFGGQ